MKGEDPESRIAQPFPKDFRRSLMQSTANLEEPKEFSPLAFYPFFDIFRAWKTTGAFPPS
jgi:hypothetical protein